jgi:hypothetical protein
MKKKLIPMVAAMAIVSFSACNNGSNETTSTDSITTSTESSTTNEGASINASGTATFNENASYVDLKTGKTVKLKKNPATGYITNLEDNSEVMYYFNPVTNDTFDRSGYVVNTYLIRGNDGSYTLDESRWKTKLDEDGDTKAKDGEGNKIKTDASSNSVKIKTDSTKEKMDNNSYKSKTPEGKVKVKENGDIKVKPNQQ